MPDNNFPPVAVPMVPVPNVCEVCLGIIGIDCYGPGCLKVVSKPSITFSDILRIKIAARDTRIAALTAENERLRGDLREAVAALEPFAKQGEIIDETGDFLGEKIPDCTWFRFFESVTAITAGDCRRAAAVVAKHRKGEAS